MIADVALYNVAYGFNATLCAGVAFYRLRNLLRYRTDYAARAITAAFVLTGSAFAVATPELYVIFDELTGVPNSATLAVYVCILLTSTLFLTVLASWTGHRGLNGVTWAAGCLVMSAMIALFVTAHPDRVEHPIDFDAYYAATPLISQFLLIYYAGFAAAMGGTAWMSGRYARMAESARPWLARGLRWTSLGALFALGYSALKVVAVLGIMYGAHTQVISTVWAPLSATIGAFMMCVGLTMPTWAPPASAVLGRVLAYRQLYPLWRLVTDAMPSVVLEPGASRWPVDRWLVRDTKHRLYRRAVEIHDARLALGPWLNPEVGDVVAVRSARDEGDERRIEAAREAAMLVAAAQAKADRAPASSRRCPPRDNSGEWDEQLWWLLAVAKALQGLPRSSVRSRP